MESMSKDKLLSQRDKYSFHIAETKRHIAGLESGEIRIISGKLNLPAAEIVFITRDFVDHFISHIDRMNEAIAMIDESLAHLDEDWPATVG
jgi:putative heme iron utilization protein